MHTDGQLYSDSLSGPPPAGCVDRPEKKSVSLGLGRDELLILGLILLLTTDRNKTDMPLLLALIYILL